MTDDRDQQMGGATPAELGKKTPTATPSSPAPTGPLDQMSKLMAAYAARDDSSPPVGQPSPGPMSIAHPPANANQSASACQSANGHPPANANHAPYVTAPFTGTGGSQGPPWWLASDGNWYPPETLPGAVPPAAYAAPPWSSPPSAPQKHGGKPVAGAIVALVIVVAVVAAAIVRNGNNQPRHVATAPAGATATAPGSTATAPPATDPTTAAVPGTLQSVTLSDLGGAPWTDLGSMVLTAEQLAPSPPCPGQPAGWGQDLSGTDSEFSYKLQANGNEAGHLLSTVLLTSSSEAVARRLVFRQSDANIPCIELDARNWFANAAGTQVVSLSTTRASMQSLEPAAMWRVKVTLTRSNGQQFVVYQDAIRIMDGPYLAVVIVDGCACLGPNPNPASELVPGEAQAIVTIGRRMRALVGH